MKITNHQSNKDDKNNTTDELKPNKILLQVKPHRKRVYQDRSIEKPSRDPERIFTSNSVQHQDMDSIEELKKEISTYFLKEGMITSYQEFIRIAYQQQFKEMDIINQDESTELANIRKRYSSDSKFLLSTKQLLYEAEQALPTEPSESLSKYLEVGNLFKEKKDFKQSSQFGKKSLNIAQSMFDPQLMMITMSQNGDVQQDLGNLNESKAQFEEAHKISITSKFSEHNTTISTKLCNIFKDMAYNNGKVTNESIYYLDKAYDFCSNIDDYKLEGDVCQSLGIAQQDLNDHKQAAVQLNKCKTLVEKHNMLNIAGKVQAALAFTLQSLGQDINAEDSLLKLFKVSVDDQENRALATATLNLGIMQQNQGKKKEAMENLRKHQEQSRKIEDVVSLDKARINQGLTLGEWSVDEQISNITQVEMQEIVSDKIKDQREADL